MGEGNHHPTGWREFILMSFRFIPERKTAAPSKEGRGRKHHPKEAEGGSTTQRRRREAAPPKGGGGRQHHQKEEGIAAIGGRHHRPKEGGEGEVHLSFLVLLSFSSGWGCFCPLLIFLIFPVGWCRSLFQNFFKELRSVRLIEVRFSSVEWRPLLLPFSSAAFPPLPCGWGCLASSSFGWRWFSAFF